jgi:hypothetical protein
MPQGLSLTWMLNAPALPVTSDKRLVYLLVESGGHDNDGVLPINVALVVDVSESMHIRVATDEQFRELADLGVLQEVLIDGVPAWQSTDIPNKVLTRLPRKIDRVRDALLAAVEQLRPPDRFALVAFAGRAITLIPNTGGDEKGRLLVIVNRLDELQLGDDTRIGQGMALGLDELQRGTSEELADRLLVLTDGFTLDEEMCRQGAARARQSRIPISTMGLGGEFNEELMIPIADQTGGEAYLIEDPKEIPAVFAQELQRAQAIRYRNLELKLRPSQGVEVRAAYRVRPAIAPLEPVNDGGSYSFQLGDLVVGEEPTLLLEMMVPPRPEGLYRLAQALLACDNPGSSLSGLKTRADIVVEYTADVSRTKQRAGRVMDVVEALSAYKLQRGAQAALEAGDVAGATRKLRAAATRLLDMGQEELAAETERQALALEKRGQADPRLTKKLRYETRKLTAHQGSTAPDAKS